MKKLLLSLFIFFCGTIVLHAQVETISLPDNQSSITTEEINALGQQNMETGSRSTIVLSFEGLGDNDYINGFYNGGTSGDGFSGTNYGVEFGVALGLIDEDAGGSGNFANEPSPSTIMYFLDQNQAYMNVAAGFTTGFSFFYTSSYNGTVSVYDGLDGTGNLLGTANLIPNAQNGNCSGDPNGFYCNWDAVSVSFSGTAKSVVFGGQANYIGFDEVTFGSTTPGGGTPGVPVSNWALIFGIFLISIFMVFRYKRNLA